MLRLNQRKIRGETAKGANRKPYPRKKVFRMSEVDFQYETGLFEDDFLHLYYLIKEELKNISFSSDGSGMKTRKKFISRKLILLIVLNWLRLYPNLRDLGTKYGVTGSLCSLYIHKVLPILRAYLDEISWDDLDTLDEFEEVGGSIDGAAHPRNRVHPNQAEWYRRDKGFCISSLVTCSNTGVIVHVALFKGHNNDQGMFNRAEISDHLVNEDLKLLADRGFSNPRLVVPVESKGKQWNNTQMSKRSIIEVVIGMVKHWKAASRTFKSNPEIHTLALMVIYQLLNIRLKQFPIR